jgi:hypothetical protein
MRGLVFVFLMACGLMAVAVLAGEKEVAARRMGR